MSKQEEYGRRMFVLLFRACIKNKKSNFYDSSKVNNIVGPIEARKIDNNNGPYSIFIDMENMTGNKVPYMIIWVDINLGNIGKEIHVFLEGIEKDYSISNFNSIGNYLVDYVRKYNIWEHKKELIKQLAPYLALQKENSEKDVVLFRGIRKPHKWYKITIGYWFSTSPFGALDYMGDKGELYIATIKKKYLDELRNTNIITAVDSSGNIYINYHFNIFNRHFSTIRKVSEEELRKLRSIESLERKRNVNHVEIAMGIFPQEYKNIFNYYKK